MWGILIGVGLSDLLFGPFVLLGIEQASITPAQSPGFSLDQIDWSHSLLMSLVWSAAYAALFMRWGSRVAGFMGIAVFSHFVLDVPMHPPDLALWPGSDVHFGLGLWRTLPHGWWFVELTLIALGGGYYLRAARGSAEFGRRPLAVVAVVVVLHIFNSPWLSAL
jgi:hypothetical protein